jgi:hypothetical protein
MRPLRLAFISSLVVGSVALPAAALADTGAPPPDAKALVAAPKAAADAPKVDTGGTDSMSATVAAGGQYSTGNSRLLAMTANGKFDLRRGANGFGASIIGNYGESAASQTTPWTTSAENFQGRLRYDRYLVDRLSLFLIGTARHDKFQGLDGRLNVDPGVKYLFILSDPTTLWVELGYDFQYDARNGSALVQVDSTGAPIPNAPLLPQTVTAHSARGFLGFKHAFNSKVTLVTGLEYLQGIASSDTVLANVATDSRVNFDALFAANLGAGFSFGLGFSSRYDAIPLPGKQNLDTTTTFNLIYSFTDIAPPPPPPTCPCPEPPPPPPPVAPPPPPPPAPSTTTTTTVTPAATTTTTTTTTPAGTTTATPAATPAPAAAPAPAPAPKP